MKSILATVHLHTHKEPNGRAYIVGDRQGLLALSKKLEQAAKGMTGLETIKLFSSDGHPYELMIVTDITEQEWQDIPVPYSKLNDPDKLELVKLYDSMRSEISS